MMLYTMKDGCLMTSNNGYDQNEKPLISFVEFLQDVAQIDDKNIFKIMVNEMVETEIKFLPDPMKTIALNTIYQFVENYDEWKDYRKYIPPNNEINNDDDDWLPIQPPKKKQKGRKG